MRADELLIRCPSNTTHDRVRRFGCLSVALSIVATAPQHGLNAQPTIFASAIPAGVISNTLRQVVQRAFS